MSRTNRYRTTRNLENTAAPEAEPARLSIEITDEARQHAGALWMLGKAITKVDEAETPDEQEIALHWVALQAAGMVISRFLGVEEAAASVDLAASLTGLDRSVIDAVTMAGTGKACDLFGRSFRDIKAAVAAGNKAGAAR